MAKMNMAVTVAHEHIATTRSIAAELEAQGFVVERVIERAGAIFGSADETMVESLGGVEGVSEVRATRDIQLPPMSVTIPQ